MKIAYLASLDGTIIGVFSSLVNAYDYAFDAGIDVDLADFVILPCTVDEPLPCLQL